MPELIEKQVDCPCCGELIDVLVDDSVPNQHYVEDCQVCCRPIILDVTVCSDGEVTIFSRLENE